MQGAISKNAAHFNSHRMMRRYDTKAYVRWRYRQRHVQQWYQAVADEFPVDVSLTIKRYPLR